MNMGRRVWLGYAIIQLIGEIGGWAWAISGPTLGPWFFGLGLVLLLPGNLVRGYLIEKLLLGKSLPILQMSFFQVLLELIINLMVWMLIAWSVRTLVARVRRRSLAAPR
jgi:hypothetical protein